MWSVVTASPGITRRCVRSPGEVERTDVPSVVLADPSSDIRAWLDARPALAESGVSLMALGTEGDLAPDLPAEQMLSALRAGFRESAALLVAARARQERDELVEIGIKLSTEKDYRTLLNEILVQARRVTGAEGGSLYLVEDQRLHFALAQNDRRPDIPFVAYSMPLDEHSSPATRPSPASHSCSRMPMTCQPARRTPSIARSTSDMVTARGRSSWYRWRITQDR